MASLRNILNPEDGRRRTVRSASTRCSVVSPAHSTRLILNMDQASTSEVPSSPETSFVSDASDNLATEELVSKDHEVHPDCPNSLACLPNTEGRPQHTLPVILRCAILGSSRQRLTIREIYAAMENKYAYYRTAGPTWKQSVRHHLSLNRLFERQPRPATDPGFGSYWTVNLSAPPGTKRPRKRGRQIKEAPDGLSLPPKKRGRPRKSSLDKDQLYSLLGEDEECKQGVTIPSSNVLDLDDLREKQDFVDCQVSTYVSEEDCESEEELVHPLDRRNSLAGSGLSAYQPSQTQQILSPPFSTFRNPDNIVDSLKTEISLLRRQSTDAISLSLRLSDQLLQVQAEASRTRDILQAVEQRFDMETRRRSELERMLNAEEKRRIKAEQALNAHLLVFTASLSLRIYEIPTTTPSKKLVHPVRVISRAHEAPVHVCKVDPTSTYLASGSADGVVKVWNIRNGFVTHVFKGHGGIVSALTFDYPQDMSSIARQQKMRLITGSVDTRLRVFDLTATSDSARGGKPEAVLEGHYSVPRGLDVSLDGKWLVSGGRDSVVLIWDLSSNQAPLQSASEKSKGKGKDKAFSPTLVKTIPVLERVEALGILRPDEDLTGSSSGSDAIRFYTGGEKGVVRIWDGKDGNVLFSLGKECAKVADDQEEQRQIVDVMYVPATSSVVSVHADQNIICHSLSTRSLTRQLIGYNDEIVDTTLLSPAFPISAVKGRDSHLALATNSSLIRIYDIHTFDARLLDGHTDVVLALDQGADGQLLASGSKDRSARLWAPLKAKPGDPAVEWGYGCVGICEGHAESIGAISVSKKADNVGGSNHPQFMFTGSQDRTIKMWDLTGIPLTCGDDEAAPSRCKSLCTHKAHDKDINALDISPNDRLLVSGSQDRTAKVFSIEYIAGSRGSAPRGELKLIGTCKGHKRGVWTVRFSRAERILATGSGDKTVKLWSLDDFSCLKTLEGHTNSVLRVNFLNVGLQIVSTSSDGLVKLWDIKSEECVTTLDNHEDKIWALAVSNDESRIVSGAADSVITFWEDCTEEQNNEKEVARANLVQKEQDFQNYIAINDYRRAIQLALAMQQPGRLLSLFRDVQTGGVDSASVTGQLSIDEVIRTLGGSELAKLLKFVRDWNTNAKTSRIAQGVMYAILKLRSADDLVKAFGDEQDEAAFIGDLNAVSRPGSALKEFVDAFIPYTERHLSRMNKLVQDSYMVDYILGEMDDGTINDMDVDSAYV
ncbi:hypothetical protein C0992_001388 [Termitomyces sp. T32_za158]|nr:hypothetical protein C0992_001388 [Termitomyces sp. T32_za158]